MIWPYALIITMLRVPGFLRSKVTEFEAGFGNTTGTKCILEKSEMDVLGQLDALPTPTACQAFSVCMC